MIAAAEVRSLLAAAGERPPHVLVSHPIAGLIHRYYPQVHAAEVAGLVGVDTAPDDWAGGCAPCCGWPPL